MGYRPYARAWLLRRLEDAEAELARATRERRETAARASLAHVAELREWLTQLDEYRLAVRLAPDEPHPKPTWVVVHGLDTYAEDACL